MVFPTSSPFLQNSTSLSPPNPLCSLDTAAEATREVTTANASTGRQLQIEPQSSLTRPSSGSGRGPTSSVVVPLPAHLTTSHRTYRGKEDLDYGAHAREDSNSGENWDDSGEVLPHFSEWQLSRTGVSQVRDQDDQNAGGMTGISGGQDSLKISCTSSGSSRGGGGGDLNNHRPSLPLTVAIGLPGSRGSGSGISRLRFGGGGHTGGSGVELHTRSNGRRPVSGGAVVVRPLPPPPDRPRPRE